MEHTINGATFTDLVLYSRSTVSRYISAKTVINVTSKITFCGEL
jgi:hypothetical protein